MNLSEYILQRLVFIWIYSHFFVLGQYRLRSPIGSELSGMHCSDETVLMICDAHAEDMAIEWYIDNILLAQYVYDRDHQYPRNVTLEPNPVLNATVQISSATISENRYFFENFTLTTSSGNLLSHKNITCGVTAQRNNTFHIKNFTIRVEATLNIAYLVKYEGITGKLMKIEVYWIDELKFAMCKTITSYMVQLRYNEEVISTRLLSTDNCTNSRCYVQFNSSDWKNSIESEIFEVIVTAYNPWFSNTFASSTILNAMGNVINLSTCNKALITCSDLFNENCSINSTTSISPVILMPGETSLLSFDRDIEISIQLNSTIFFTQANYIGTMSDTEKRVFVEVGVAVLIFGSIIFALGCVLGIVSKVQNNANKDYRYMWRVTLFFSIIPTVILIVTLVLWIIVGSTSSLDSCFNDGVSPDPILIATLVFSFVLLLLAPITLGGFLVTLKCERKHRSHKKETFISYEVKFGTKKVKVEDNNGVQKCTICSQPFSCIHENEDGIVVFRVSSGKEHFCNICSKHMCENCFKIVYLKYCKREMDICSNCYKDYQAEKKKIPSSLQLGNIKPPQVDCSKYCKECGHEEGQKYPRWERTEEMYTANMSVCSTCGQWVCNECFDEHEMEVKYLHERRQVCKNCYALHKMTSQDDKEDSEKKVSLDTMARAEVTENKQNINSTSL